MKKTKMLNGGEYKTKIGERLSGLAKSENLSIDDMAQIFGTVYETARIVLNGSFIPSKHILRAAAKYFGVDVKELERIADEDRIRKKFGTLPLELSGQNPELEPIERAWSKLSGAHKKDLTTIVLAFAEQDSKSGQN